ncbi:MAG TPA: hypothetical protein VLG12_06660, partial [Candidatus Saccharimonadales bacterium]|nr:hypothetical protein [Candidatus Saccharimonadales bacterium]
KYISPLDFSAENKYKLSFYSEDNDSNIEDIKNYEFQIDKTSPTTSVDISGTGGENGWYKSDVGITLSAVDSLSGINKTKYSIDDGQTYINYNGVVNFPNEGVSKFKYYSTDKAGNIENAHSVDWKIDKTAPSTVVYTTGIRGQTGWYRTDVEIAFNGKDDVSGLQKTLYSLDNGQSYHDYVDPLVFKDEGYSKIIYYSIDNAGNEETKNTIEFNIDKTPPIVTINATPNSIWPPNGKMIDVKVMGNIDEKNLYSKTFKVIDEYGLVQPSLADFNQTIKLQADRNGTDKDSRIYQIQAKAEDFAGNISNVSTNVIVPHDQGK